MMYSTHAKVTSRQLLLYSGFAVILTACGGGNSSTTSVADNTGIAAEATTVEEITDQVGSEVDDIANDTSTETVPVSAIEVGVIDPVPPAAEEPPPATEPDPDPGIVPEPDPEPAPEPVQVKPAFGIYVLDGAIGTYRDGHIRDYDFVDGYAWRASWGEIEVGKGVYDFSGLDHIVTKLSAINQKLSWLVTGSSVPAYLTADPNIDTWVDAGEIKPSAWDPQLQARYHAFIDAVANHKIADPAQNGDMVAFKDHSVLSVLHPNFPGLPRNTLRNGDDTTVAETPGFTRQKLAQVIESSLGYWEKSFPNKPLLVSLWTINDSDRNYPLWQFAQDELTKYGNVGFFQDNLQAGRDCQQCALDLGPPADGMGRSLVHEKGWSGLQMLGSWDKPLPNHEENLKFGTPEEGMNYAYDNFNTIYFEVYSPDIDKPEWQSSFRNWAKVVRDQSDVRAKLVYPD